jgi:hypothetical protein
MSDNNDTSAIDDKKEETSNNNSDNLTAGLAGFITSVIGVILLVMLYFSSSGLVLFVCKLAQSNILPTEENCYPYTENKPNIESIKTNIFTTFTEPEMSMKLEFPYDEYNSANKIVDTFRQYKNKPSSNFLANYFISICEQLLNFNYSTINTVMNSMNRLPEGLIIGLGPIVVAIMFSIMGLINVFYTIYLWFANMSWFFKTNTNESDNGLPKWEDVTLLSPISWFLAFSLVVLFTIIFFLGFGVISIVPFAILFYACLTTLMYKGKLNDKNATSFTIIKNILKHYKVSIIGIISFFVILLAFSNLGVIQGIFSLIILGLMYWGVISNDLFKPIIESHLTPVVSFNQATKSCNIKQINKEKHGFLYNLLMGQSGGNLTKQLKKIGKNLDNK